MFFDCDNIGRLIKGKRCNLCIKFTPSKFLYFPTGEEPDWTTRTRRLSDMRG